MGKVIISASGGGTTSDECTALRSCILSPYTAVTSDSNDEPIQGTMQRRSDNPTSASLRDDGNNLRMYPPSGYYDGVNDYTWDSYATIASRIGLTASDLRTNKRVLGLTGTFTNDAVLNPDMLVEGYSGYDDGVKKNGTMKNRGSSAMSLKTAISSLGDRIYAKFPKGAYFDESTASPNPYVHILFTDLARAIGLTSDKIKKGITIAGVTGTYVYSDITGYYYQPPNEMAGVTGGFITKFEGKYGFDDEAEFSKQTTYMEVFCTTKHYDVSHTSNGFFVTSKAINLTNVRTIRVTYSGTNGNSYGFGVSTNQNDISNSKVVYYSSSKYIDMNAPETQSLDVSMLKGSHYLFFYACSYYGTSTGSHSSRIRVFKIEYDTMA